MDVFLSLVSILGMIVAALALVAGLLSAPWQILLLLLLAGLFGLRWLSAQSDRLSIDIDRQLAQEDTDSFRAVPSPPAFSAPEQALVYRGSRYKLQEEGIEATQSLEVSGKYRGGLWRSIQSVKASPH